MSTGSKKNDFDFGVEDGADKRAPLPSDIARAASATPLSAERAERAERRGKGSRQAEQEEFSELFVSDRRLRRRKTGAIAAVLIVLSIVSLFTDTGYAAFFAPDEVFTCYGIWFQQIFSGLSGSGDVESGGQIVFEHAAYFRIINRLGITLMTILCGAVLAVAGTLYQSAFRNPIASPSMLGTSSAIQLGNVLLVLIFGASAGLVLGYRYLICYVCVVVVMGLLFFFAWLMTGRGRQLNVVNLLLVATILSQIIGVVVTYITMFVFDDELWEVYQNISEALSVNLDPFSWAVFLVTCAIGLIPVIVLRFRLNGLNFDDAEMKLLGVDAARLRLLALVCGTVLLLGAQVQMGTIAMLALVVPHVSRMLFGAEFRKQFWGNVFMGAALLVLCRVVVGFVPVVGDILPVSVVLNFVVLPFFVWMLATQQRGWEQ